jgi:phosphate transport system substrate-binding protein
MIRMFSVSLGLLGLVACGQGGQTVLQDKGSDTMVNLMQRMSEEYSKVDPTVVIAVSGGGSGTGIKSLIDKTTEMANASREMKPEEIAEAEKNGVHPVANMVAYDGLSIYVNAANPITSINFDQLKCIFASDGTCNHWKDVGVTIDCGGGDDQIVKIGRQNNSGTYEYFRETILGKEGKFTNTMDQSGTQQVVDVIGTTQCAIGYGGMGYHTAKARFVCLTKAADQPCSEPSVDGVKAGTYPFSRPLYVYTDGEPTGAVKTYLDWIKGDAGQKIVLDAGFVPLTK